MPQTPEEQARVLIDAALTASGWIVQAYRDMNLAAGPGLAVTEFPGAHGPADYLLYVDAKAIGVVEAKPVGHTLRGVEGQSASYSEGLPESLPAWRRPLPFQYESTGEVTQFTNWMEPHARSRDIFSFHRPETLREMAQTDKPLRAGLREMPQLTPAGLWP
ncbi:MAG: restriction endonuclease subunit R, partial [Phycisphaerales bacterium]|nr:restriction endonuclease subunit R [Phycisphaerales bacterium]